MKKVELELPDELYELVRADAERQFRTPEGQISWFLASRYRAEQSRHVRAEAAGDFSAALRELRRNEGQPSLRDIAARADVSHTTVHSMLHGDSFPAWKRAEAVIRALGGDVDAFRSLWLDARDRDVAPVERT
jgi:hypothetical protein